MDPADSSSMDEVQDALDVAFRAYFRGRPDVGAALTYGSRPAGLGDEYSDVEYWVFVDDVDGWNEADWFPDVEGGPIHQVENEFGAVVATYPGLVRAEVHVWPYSEIDVVRSWPARGATVDSMVLIDREGRLADALATLPERPSTPRTAAEIDRLCGQFANWWVLGWNVLRRGELARAEDALSHVRRHLLWMARVAEGATERWLTPSRLAEEDLSDEFLAEYHGRIGSVDREALVLSYEKNWRLGERLWRDLGTPVPERLLAEVSSALETPGPN